ncbi:MAG: glycosyltransferase family 4 protein [Brevibacillus sp.]|nr:glycosyltransferase family 4 protein [Brevibacillus sp.]
MRILLATYWGLPHVGGVWAYVEALRRSLEKQGHQVDIFASHASQQSYYLLNTAQTVDKQPIVDLVSPLIRQYYRGHAPALSAILAQHEIERSCFEVAAMCFDLDRYDLIHTQDVISTRALWRVKPEGVPLVATIHGCLAEEYLTHLDTVEPPDTPPWHQVWLREHYGACSSDHTIVPTNWLRQTLSSQYSVPAEHLSVVPYGMEVERFEQKMREASDVTRPEDKHVMICPARLVKVKGHPDLLEALFLLKQQRQDWVCWIVGDGDRRQDLEKLVQRLQLEQEVLFLGNRDDVPALLKQADLFVLPSRTDTLPYAVMEAQLAQVPVVVSDSGGLPEMVTHEQTGLLYPVGQSSTLCACLQRLIENRRLRGELAERGYQWALKQWSLDTMVNRICTVYANVLNRGQYSPQTGESSPGDLPPVPLPAMTTSAASIQVPPGYSLVDRPFFAAWRRRWRKQDGSPGES